VAPFEGIDLARIGSLTATVDIKSVFDDKIDIKRIGLVKPYIHVKVLEDGRANWDIAKADSSASERRSGGYGDRKFNIGLREYWIEDGTLDLRRCLAHLLHGPERAWTTPAVATSPRTSSR
jgi:uncharacterized protein involved in outer membrane biogenesis